MIRQFHTPNSFQLQSKGDFLMSEMLNAGILSAVLILVGLSLGFALLKLQGGEE